VARAVLAIHESTGDLPSTRMSILSILTNILFEEKLRGETPVPESNTPLLGDSEQGTLFGHTYGSRLASSLILLFIIQPPHDWPFTQVEQFVPNGWRDGPLEAQDRPGGTQYSANGVPPLGWSYWS